MRLGRVYSAALSREHPEDVVRRVLQQMRTLYTFGFESTSTPTSPASWLSSARALTPRQAPPDDPVLCQ